MAVPGASPADPNHGVDMEEVRCPDLWRLTEADELEASWHLEGEPPAQPGRGTGLWEVRRHQGRSRKLAEQELRELEAAREEPLAQQISWRRQGGLWQVCRHERRKKKLGEPELLELAAAQEELLAQQISWCRQGGRPADLVQGMGLEGLELLELEELEAAREGRRPTPRAQPLQAWTPGERRRSSSTPCAQRQSFAEKKAMLVRMPFQGKQTREAISKDTADLAEVGGHAAMWPVFFYKKKGPPLLERSRGAKSLSALWAGIRATKAARVAPLTQEPPCHGHGA